MLLSALIAWSALGAAPDLQDRIQAAYRRGEREFSIGGVMELDSTLFLADMPGLTLKDGELRLSTPATTRRLRESDSVWVAVPPEVRAQTWVVDLSLAGAWSFPRNGASDLEVAPPSLFLDGKPVPLARWPARGWVRTDGAEGDRRLRLLGMPAYGAAESLVLQGFIYQPEFFDYSGPAHRSGSWVVLERPGGRYQGGTIALNSRVRVKNGLSDLTLGTCVLDPGRRKAYVAASGDLTSRLRVALEPGAVIRLGPNMDRFRLKNVRVAEGRWHGLEFTKAVRGLAIEESSFEFLGGRGITGTEIGPGFRLLSSTFRDIGGSGVFFRAGDPWTLEDGDALIDGAGFLRTSQATMAAEPAVMVRGTGWRIQNSWFRELPANAIILEEARRVTIEGSGFRDVGLETGDVGVIYGWGDPLQFGVILRDLRFIDCRWRGEQGRSFVVCAYLDDGTGGWTIENLRAERSDELVAIGGGSHVSVSNVEHVDGTKHPVNVDDRMRGHSWWSAKGRFTEQLGKAKSSPAFSPYAEKIQALGKGATNVRVAGVKATGSSPKQRPLPPFVKQN